MRTIPVLLISQDATLIEAVGKIVETIRGCDYVAASQVDQGLEFLADNHDALLICHATAGSDDVIGWLLHELHGTKRALATLVISDESRPGVLLEMLTRGAADCLCRPLDLRRLAFLVRFADAAGPACASGRDAADRGSAPRQ